jgi:hypothetical protein
MKTTYSLTHTHSHACTHIHIHTGRIGIPHGFAFGLLHSVLPQRSRIRLDAEVVKLLQKFQTLNCKHALERLWHHAEGYKNNINRRSVLRKHPNTQHNIDNVATQCKNNTTSTVWQMECEHPNTISTVWHWSVDTHHNIVSVATQCHHPNTTSTV